MKTNELKIGNFVYFLGNVHEIEGLSKRLRPDVGHFLLSNMEHAQKGFHLKPIPLTEEWLFKFGFVKGSLYFKKGLLDCVEISEDGSFNIYYGEDENNSISIQYVHQLQNLYFALTGEELL